MKKPSQKQLNDYLYQFHNWNLYVPKRTIYFGGLETEEGSYSDEVNSMTSAQLIKNLYVLDNLNHNVITLFLNSDGGNWEEGIAIYDVIRKLKSKVNIHVLGKAYSMAGIILQAGNQRILHENSFIMLHDGTEGFQGDAKSFENWAKYSRITREIMYKIFYKQMKKKNSRITLKEIEELCSHDTILSAKEAVKKGLADKIL